MDKKTFRSFFFVVLFFEFFLGFPPQVFFTFCFFYSQSFVLRKRSFSLSRPEIPFLREKPPLLSSSRWRKRRRSSLSGAQTGHRLVAEKKASFDFAAECRCAFRSKEPHLVASLRGFWPLVSKTRKRARIPSRTKGQGVAARVEASGQLR